MESMIRRLAGVLVLTLVLMPAGPASAADQGMRVEPGLQELVLKDGSRLFGTIEREDDREVVFRAHSGALVIAQRSDILSIRPVKGRVRQGEFYRTDIHRTRLFFAPTARSLAPRQASFGVFEVSMPFVQVGVTDRFSLGGGTPLVFGLDESSRPFWITPKLQIYDGGTRQAAVGVFHIFNADGLGAGIAYGVGTFGTEDDAVTIGGGMAYSDDSRGGVVMVGAEKRVRPGIKFITENYAWSGGAGLVSGGVRFIGEHLSADVGLAIPWGVDVFVVVPVVNFVYVF
jgi:hypothetical protein